LLGVLIHEVRPRKQGVGCDEQAVEVCGRFLIFFLIVFFFFLVFFLIGVRGLKVFFVEICWLVMSSRVIEINNEVRS